MLVGEAPGCFTGDVEVLTLEGWKRFDEYTSELYIAQYNKDDSTIEFVEPSQIITEQYEGSMIKLEGRLSTTVTPNHRFLLYNKYQENLLVERADELRLKYPEQSFLLSGEKKDGISIDEDLLRLLVATQADGSYEHNQIRFEFAKRRKIDRLLIILYNLGVNYKVGKENERGTFRLSVTNDNLAYNFIKKALPDKIFDWRLLQLDNKSLHIILNELKYWDGDVDTRGANYAYFSYYSSIQQNIDVVQAIAHLCSHRAYYSEHARSIRMSISKHKLVGVKAVSSTTEYYKGKVYCLKTPSSFFLVRSKGKVFITGNSEENRTGLPFQGPAGRTLDMLLSQAGITRQDCLIANVMREKPPGNKISFYYEDSKCTVPKAIAKAFIEYLRKEIATLRPNIVVALGATALYTLTGMKGIERARGYITESTLVPGIKVLPTYHPQAVGYTWNLGFQVVMDLRKALANSYTPDLPKDDRVLQSSVSKHEYLQYLEWLLNEHKEPIAVDIETASPGSHIDIMGIADSPKHAVSFELISNRKPKYSLDGELEVWQSLDRVLSTKDLIMQNAAYDITVLWYNNKIFCKNIIADTMIATHVCWPEVPRNLGFQASICLNVPAWKHLQFEASAFYNASDAANTYGIWEVLEKELEKLKQRQVFDAEMKQIHPSIMLQVQGLYVDNKKRLEMKEETTSALTELEDQLETEIGRKVNFNSYKQLQQLLFIDMNLPVQFKRRKSINDPRKMTSDEEALKKLLRQSGNPILEKIMKVKKLSKLLSSFINITTSPQSRVHTSYNITGITMQRQKGKHLIYDEEGSKKSFGRWSSSASIILPYGPGNLQNIPEAARIFYPAGKGMKFLVADYIQAEAVITAYLSNDHKLKKMFKDSFGATKKERKKNNWDVHKMKASEMFRIPLEDVTSEQRRIGKTIRHARNYAAGPGVLANKLSIKLGKAKELIKIDKEVNPQLELWHLRIQAELRKTRTLTNLLGRTHRFLDRWPKPGEDGPLFRSAYSFIPQSSVGDLLNQSLVRLYNRYGSWINISAQLHDAIYVIVPEDRVQEDRVQEAAKAMKECMLYPLYCNGEEFIIDVDFKVGDNWKELEDYEIPRKE